MQTAFAAMVKALGVQAGRKDLAPDGNSCELVFDDLPVTLHYLEATDDILVYCVVGLVPEDERERLALFTALLEANFFFRHTAGSTLGVDGKSGLVSMQRLIPVQGLEESSFLSLLESYLNLATLWRNHCASPAAAPDAGAGASSEPGREWVMA